MTNKSEQAKSISHKIKELRDTLDWNQADLARQAGVTPAAISQIEKGERIPSLVVARKIASALSVSLEVLIGERGPSSGEEQRIRAFYRKFGEIDQLPGEDQKKIEEFMELVKDARTSRNGGDGK